MSLVLKQGMNLPAFAKELEALVEKHGGILRTTPSISVSQPKISNTRFGPYDAQEERTPIEIAVQIKAESIEVFSCHGRGA